MIGYWHQHVVRLSVRMSVTLCIVGLMVGVQYRAKSCTSVFLAGMFPFVRSVTFAVGCIVSYKTHREKRVEENANVCTGL